MSDIETTFTRLCRVLDVAEQRFKHRGTEAAVALAQIGARYAFPCNVGIFAAPRLEPLLVSIGQSRPVSATTQRQEHTRRL